jgi:hypothetical protein
MDDFLYNLRTGNLRRGDKDHRQGRSSQYKGPQRRNGGDRRRMLPDIEGLSEQLSSIEKHLKQIAIEQRRIADAAEREADALDLITHHFEREKKLAFDTAPPVPVPPAPTAPSEASLDSQSAEPTDQESDRAATLDLIKRLRNQQMSYAKIAEHLEAHGIATFSGRGKWYATTVSKLLQTEA